MSSVFKKRMDSHALIPEKTVEQISEPRKSTFTKLIPENNIELLLKYVEGKPWTVHYYGQYLNNASTLNFLDLKQGNLSQSYVEIKDLILQVQDELNFDYNKDDGDSTITGSAVLPFKVRPQTGDLFLANVDSGEDALFVVVDARRLAKEKKTLYEIEYSLLVYVNDDPTFLDTLQKRIQNSYFYNNYNDTRNQNYLITTDEKVNIDNLRRFLYLTQESYFKTFVQPASYSLGIPGLDVLAIDIPMCDFLHETIDISKFINMNDYRHSVYSQDFRRENILDCIKKRKLPNVNMTEKYFAFHHTRQYFRYVGIYSPQFSYINYLLFPYKPNRDMISGLPAERSNPTAVFNIKNGKNYYLSPDINIDCIYRDGDGLKPLLHELFVNNSYIVTEDFYEYLNNNKNYDKISFIELIIARHLKGEKIAHSDLIKCIVQWEDWSLLHKFYILPVVWYLIKVNLGRI